MDGLLANLIARQPDEVHPVVDLVLGIRHAFLTLTVPDSGGAVPCSHPLDGANRTLLDHFDRFDVVLLTPVLRAGHNGGPIFLGEFVRLFANPPAGGIHTHWLLGEDMLAGLHSFQHMTRTESRGCSEVHDIHTWVVQNRFVAIQANVGLLVGNLNLVTMRLLEVCFGRLDLALIHIRDGHQPDTVVDRHGVTNRAFASSATTHQSQVEGVFPSHPEPTRKGSGGGNRGGGGQKLSAIG